MLTWFSSTQQTLSLTHARVLQGLPLPHNSPLPLHRRRAKHLAAVCADLRLRNHVPSTQPRHPKSNEAHLREPKIELLLCTSSCLGLETEGPLRKWNPETNDI